MEYKNIQALKAAFLSGGIDALPPALFVSGIKYHTSHTNTYEFNAIVTNKKKPMVIYSLDQELKNKAKYSEMHTTAEDVNSVQNRIVFVWAATKLKIAPLSVKFVPKQRTAQLSLSEADIDDSRIIKHKIKIILNGFNQNNEIDAKVDTGATMCSLDANDVKIDSDSGVVSFSFGGSTITMPLVDSQAIKSADGGTETRPVVSFDITVPTQDANNKTRKINKVRFNLNDRSNMPDKILLGQNFIKAGDFVVMRNDDHNNKVIECQDSDVFASLFDGLELVDDQVITTEALVEYFTANVSEIVEKLNDK